MFEQEVRPRVVLAAVTLATPAYVLVGFLGPPPLYDEGVSVYGAVRVLDGHRPYRDFWTMYAPGQFYLLAALFKLFGVSLLVERLATAAIIAASGALVYAVAARLMPPGFAFLASALWTSLIAWFRFYGNAMPTAMLAILVSWWALLAYFRAPTAGTLVAAGGAVGLAALFRHDLGGYAFLAAVAVLAAPPHEGRWRRLAIFVAGAAAPVAGAAIALVAVGVAPRDALDGLLVFPLTGYAAARTLPAPPLLTASLAQADASLRFYFPVPVLVAAATVGAWRWRDLAPFERRAGALLVLSVALLLNQARVRSDLPHAVPAWLPAALLCAWLLARMPGVRLRATMAVAAALVLVGRPALHRGNEFVEPIARLLADDTRAFAYSLPRAYGIGDPRPWAPAYEAAIEYLRATVPPGERIYVGNWRHDLVVTGDVMLYFLAERHSATRWHELHPGVTTTAEIQAAIVHDLERAGIRYVVVRPDPQPSEPASRSSGVHLLDRYIRERFEPVAEFGTVVIARRRATLGPER